METALTFQSGVQLGQQSVKLGKFVQPNQSIDVTVDCTAPADEGGHISFYRLEVMNGMAVEQIGPKVWIDIIVKKSEDQSMGLKSLMEPNS